MCFLAELTLGRGGSAPVVVVADDVEGDALRENHREGFVRNWVKGEVERGNAAAGWSAGLSEFGYRPIR